MAESVRSDPAVLASQGDDQIRTGVVGLSTDSVYGGCGARCRRGVSWLIWLTVVLLVANLADQARPW